jgi:hypothetical protein
MLTLMLLGRGLSAAKGDWVAVPSGLLIGEIVILGDWVENGL